MSSTKPPRWMKAADLEGEVRGLLAADFSDEALRERLETLARQPAFSGLTWLWGPRLYRRHRVLFRPFILAHFGEVQFDPPRSFGRVPWKGAVGRDLDDWLAEVDRRDDVALFQKLCRWRLTMGPRLIPDHRRAQTEMLDRLRSATTAGTRKLVFEKYNFWFHLDEGAAVELYRIDPAAAGPFILNRLPQSVWLAEKRVLWTWLMALAEKAGDVKTQWTLYRRQVPLTQWAADVLARADKVADPEALTAELERRHPEIWGKDLGGVFYQLLEKRGRDVIPYLKKHLFHVRSRFFLQSHFDRMLDLAHQKGWFGFWAALLRTSGRPVEYNREVARLISDQRTPEPQIVDRLGMLAGVSRELNFPGFSLAVVPPLDEPVALQMYSRFPDLVRGPFRAAIAPTWGRSYPRFIERLVNAGDEDLIDYLASRFITRGGYSAQKNQLVEADRLADYYQGLKVDELGFARRAAAVLGQIPAYAIYDYNRLVRDNRLARLFFERSSRFFLADENGLRDLVEAPEIHVQALAYRALGLTDDRARTLATQNVTVLLGTLLRPLHRTTRLLAFGALANAAQTPDLARRIHARAREALDLPDIRYPKEALVGLIGRLLADWPELRAEGETPVVFGEATA